jgi:hypothetical protein
MNNANLSPEISHLHKDLSDHILARDWEGASRIYQELLRAGQSLELLTAHVPALQNTSALELFGQEQPADEQSSAILDVPMRQAGAELEAARGSLIERAAERLDRTIGSRTGHSARRGFQRTGHQPSQAEFERVARGARLRYGPARPSRFWLICLGLVSVLTVAAAGSAFFWLERAAQENAAAESAPAPQISAKAPQNTSSSGDLTTTPQAAGSAQSVTPAGATATPAPAVTPTPSLPPPGGLVTTAARTQPNKPELAITPATPTPETASTGVPPGSQKPPTRPAFSGVEVTTLLARGDWLFATGDVDSARLLYERAAQAGDAQGAVRLGQTFDPVFLDRAHLREARADPGMAVFWYRRARDLGAMGITSRLKSLEAKLP